MRITRKASLFTLALIACSLTFAQEASNSNQKWGHTLEDSGDILMIALPAAAGITTLIKKDFEGTKQFALSYASTFLITYSLKHLIRKQRPEGSHLFNAFPSGHTSSAFSGASFIHRRYGWKYGKYAYVLAAVVGISRVEGPGSWHDYWDVLGGVVVGIGSTYLFTKPYQPDSIQLTFRSDGKDFLVGLKWKL